MSRRVKVGDANQHFGFMSGKFAAPIAVLLIGLAHSSFESGTLGRALADVPAAEQQSAQEGAGQWPDETHGLSDERPTSPVGVKATAPPGARAVGTKDPRPALKSTRAKSLNSAPTPNSEKNSSSAVRAPKPKALAVPAGTTKNQVGNKVGNEVGDEEVVLLPAPAADAAVEDRIIDPSDPQNMQKILLSEFADRLGRQPKTSEFLKAMKNRLADDEYAVLENRGELASDPALPKLQLLTSGDYAFRHGVKLIKFRYLDVRKGQIELNGFKLAMAPTRSATERWNKVLQVLPKKLDLAIRPELPFFEMLALFEMLGRLPRAEAQDIKRAPKTVAMAIAASAMAFVGYHDSLCYELLSTDAECRDLSAEVRDRVDAHLERLKIPDPVTGRLPNQSRCLPRDVNFEERIRSHLVDVRSLLAAYGVDVEKLYKPYEGLCQKIVDTAKTCWKTLQTDLHQACIPFPNLNE